MRQSHIQKLRKRLMLLTQKQLSIQEIAEKLNVDKSNIYRALYKLQKLNYITKKRTITNNGFSFLRESLILSPKTQRFFRLHKLMFRLKIIKAYKNLYKKLEQVFIIHTWIANKVVFKEFITENVRVRVISDSVLIYTPEIIAQSPLKAKEQALDILYDIIPKLEKKLNVELSTKPYMVIHVGSQHIALLNSTIAKYFLDAGIRLEVIDEQGHYRLIVDDSKRLNELETIHKFYAEEDARKVKDFLADIVINDKWKKLKKDVEKLKAKIIAKERVSYVG